MSEFFNELPAETGHDAPPASELELSQVAELSLRALTVARATQDRVALMQSEAKETRTVVEMKAKQNEEQFNEIQRGLSALMSLSPVRASRSENVSQQIQPTGGRDEATALNHYPVGPVAVEGTVRRNLEFQFDGCVAFKRQDMLSRIVGMQNHRTPVQQALLMSVGTGKRALDDFTLEELEEELERVKEVITRQGTALKTKAGFESRLGDLYLCERTRDLLKAEKARHTDPETIKTFNTLLHMRTLEQLQILNAYFYAEHGYRSMRDGLEGMTPEERIYVQRTAGIMRDDLRKLADPGQRDAAFVDYINAVPGSMPKDASKHKQLEFVWQQLGRKYTWLQDLARSISS
jgi:hypothetical protein